MNTKTQFVSILIPVYNREDTIAPCIESALAQRYLDFEVVVVDNASTDQTWAICQQMAGADQRLRVFRNQENLGPVRNWIRCMEEARGPLAKILFSDDLMHADYLPQTAPFLADGDVAFVFTATQIARTTREHSRLFYLPFNSTGTYPSTSFIEGSLAVDGSFPVSPGAAIFRLADLRKNIQIELPGAGVEDFAAHGAGPDLLLYLLTALDYSRCAYVREPLSFFRMHPSSITCSDQKGYVPACHQAARQWFVQEAQWPSARARKVLEDGPSTADSVAAIEPGKRSRPYLVSALVSAYNSSRFISGCMNDLLGQTLGNSLEIVVVDSGSEQNEAEIVRAFQLQATNIKYVRTERESLYAAWTRAAQLAQGEFLTIANTDDRHRCDALEQLAGALLRDPTKHLSYADCVSTDVEEDDFDGAIRRRGRLFRYPEFLPPTALLHFQFGPQFLWRRSICDEVGYFDGSYTAAGDYDFNLRFVQKADALHLPQLLGSYLVRRDAISQTGTQMSQETARVRSQYRTMDVIERLYQRAGIACRNDRDRARILVDLGVRASSYTVPWALGSFVSELAFAVDCFTKAIGFDPAGYVAYNNLAAVLVASGVDLPKEQLSGILAQGARQPGAGNSPTFLANLRQIAATSTERPVLSMIPSSLPLPSQIELYVETTGPWQRPRPLGPEVCPTTARKSASPQSAPAH
jgi:glycosyltransferase involved in cell wall biosynthesis